eukprot:TRINITY_DN59781_c0_g1_i1.p1 TRINITY_DN59781_c0_g1~~TRINITY_DN59781_c0_g1_i1.p1  ORF type:complete len:603 (+),score=128.78 TRINITY_DN59781_c0_g1_i1:97-1905(+)
MLSECIQQPSHVGGAFPAEEKDDVVRNTRQRQIDIGKARPEYKRYLQQVQRERRGSDQPHTPDPRARISKRQFDRLVSDWRRQLHAYDAVPTEPQKRRSTATTASTTASSVDASLLEGSGLKPGSRRYRCRMAKLQREQGEALQKEQVVSSVTAGGGLKLETVPAAAGCFGRGFAKAWADLASDSDSGLDIGGLRPASVAASHFSICTPTASPCGSPPPEEEDDEEDGVDPVDSDTVVRTPPLMSCPRQCSFEEFVEPLPRTRSPSRDYCHQKVCTPDIGVPVDQVAARLGQVSADVIYPPPLPEPTFKLRHGPTDAAGVLPADIRSTTPSTTSTVDSSLAAESVYLTQQRREARRSFVVEAGTPSSSSEDCRSSSSRLTKCQAAKDQLRDEIAAAERLERDLKRHLARVRGHEAHRQEDPEEMSSGADATLLRVQTLKAKRCTTLSDLLPEKKRSLPVKRSSQGMHMDVLRKTILEGIAMAKESASSPEPPPPRVRSSKSASVASSSAASVFSTEEEAVLIEMRNAMRELQQAVQMQQGIMEAQAAEIASLRAEVQAREARKVLQSGYNAGQQLVAAGVSSGGHRGRSPRRTFGGGGGGHG